MAEMPEEIKLCVNVSDVENQSAMPKRMTTAAGAKIAPLTKHNRKRIQQWKNMRLQHPQFAALAI